MDYSTTVCFCSLKVLSIIVYIQSYVISLAIAESHIYVMNINHVIVVDLAPQLVSGSLQVLMDYLVPVALVVWLAFLVSRETEDYQVLLVSREQLDLLVFQVTNIFLQGL